MTTMTHDIVSDVQHRQGRGLAIALVSAFAFGLSGPLAKGLITSGWTPAAAVTLRSLVAAAVLLVPALWSLRGRWQVVRDNAGLLVFYGLVPVAATQVLFFTAVAHLQVSVALLIEYTAPVAVVTWLWLRHGRRPSRLTLVGAGVAALGLVLVLDVLAGASVSTIGLLCSLGAMVGAAIYFVVNASSDADLPPLVLAAGGLLVGGLALVVAGLAQIVPWRAVTVDVDLAGQLVPVWVPVVLLGAVTAALAYVTGIFAGRLLGAQLSSFVALSEVLAAVVWAWLLLGETPGATQVVGGLLVLAGVVLVKLGEPGRVSDTLSS